jgi:aspartyl-tRNA(Asn)/glutamyl-tRNA(Gln) amidotransferase subunit B
MTAYEPIIGLEVHAELLTASKMFCACAVVDSTSAEPNTAVCEICTGMPGTLPVINRRAVEYALRVALALGGTPAERSVFARKNYFYPDLPKGYQISQYEYPLSSGGVLEIETEAGPKRIRIRRVHLEEDTGKLAHRDGYSLVDYNRSGVPLLEIVSEPDLNSVEEVKAYARGMRSLLRYLEVSSGDMEKGVIRFEANVSVRPAGTGSLGTRTEIKNLNSFRAMVRAVEYEVERQSHILSGGGKVLQETLGWDEKQSETISQRGKEEAHDYRYFPEPDLPPLLVDAEWVDSIQRGIPELPEQKRARYVQEYDLTSYTAAVIAADRSVAEFYEACVSSGVPAPPPKIAHWISGDLFALLNEGGIDIRGANIRPDSFTQLVAMVEVGEINTTTAKLVLDEMYRTGREPGAIVEARELAVLADEEAIRKIVRAVLEDSPNQLETFLNGKAGVFEWFFGQVMKRTEGKADPVVLRGILAQELTSHEESRPAGT